MSPLKYLNMISAFSHRYDMFTVLGLEIMNYLHVIKKHGEKRYKLNISTSCEDS